MPSSANIANNTTATATNGHTTLPAVTLPAHPRPAAHANTQASLREIQDRHPNNTIPWRDNLGQRGRVVGGHATVSNAATHDDRAVGNDAVPAGAVAPEMKSDNDFLYMATWTSE